MLSAICMLQGLEEYKQILSGKESVWTSDVSPIPTNYCLSPKKKKKTVAKGNKEKTYSSSCIRKIFGPLFDMHALFLPNYHVYPVI